MGQIRGSLRICGQLYNFDHALTTEDLSMSANEISDLVGDANARISVSYGMSDKDYGNGFDAHVSVSLSCDQEEAIIGFAYEAASGVAQEKMRDAILKAKELYDEYEDGVKGGN